MTRLLVVFLLNNPVVILNDQLDENQLDAIIAEHAIECIVVSPGPGTPASCQDAGINPKVFSRYTDMPIFGVCFGFQCLCQVHGGAAIVRAPQPVHGRTSAVYHGEDALFRNIPSGTSYEVVRYHSLCVDPASLNSAAVVPLAWSWADPCHVESSVGEGFGEHEGIDDGTFQSGSRVIMAAKHVKYPHYGVQFHPESICTTYGHALLENFRDLAASWNATQRDAKGEKDDRDDGQIGDKGPHDVSSLSNKAAKDYPPTLMPNELTAPTARRLGVELETIEGCLNGITGGTERIMEVLFTRQGTEDVFFLDSSTPERTRFSYMGGAGGPLWRRVSYVLNRDKADMGGTLTVEDRQGGSSVAECPSIFDWITAETSLYSDFDDKLSSLPFDFWGGPVGYLGYELKCQTGGQKAHVSPNCDACFFIIDRFVCADHHTGDVYVVAVFDASSLVDRAEAGSWVAEVADTCRRLSSYGKEAHVCADTDDCDSESNIRPHTNQEPPSRGLPLLSAFSERHPGPSYKEKVKKCQASLHSGDSYELCLTNMMTSLRAPDDAKPWSVYKRLRRRNPAPYAAFIDFSAMSSPISSTATEKVTHTALGPVLCCSSPERFLRGTRHGALEAKPIKGTVRRHLDDPKRDEEAARLLLESEKDRAENLMIVDLLRNDLGRVAETGSVRVTGLMRIESFATVHQMVSTITAQKKTTVGTGDVIRAAFPGGSMTGAPKIRSMDILDALEEGPRGVYSGSLGYISWNRAFDLNIVIRTAIFNVDKILVGAGGAIVVQSDPQDEYDEMKLKFETLRVT